MSDQEPEKNNLINFIAVTVESLSDQMSEMHGQISEMRDQIVTKSDLDQMATKSDVNSLKGDVDSLRDEVAYMGGQVETMRDQMATKSDLAQLESRLTTRLEVETTAIRGDIEQVHLRLDSIDRTLRARLDQIETEMSRLRSVLYLLVKDKPEMLRLLGQSPPASDEGRP
jgi:chromosome segregation ATPase